MQASRMEAMERIRVKSRAKALPLNDRAGYLFLKRMIDIVASVFGLLLLSPIFILLALFIKWEDRKGPVFFKQTRIGKNGEAFTMYKFRSMCSNAEDLLTGLLEKNEVDGLMFKMKQDPRVTNVGKFIRKTSIDELPQLFNVLKGEMSLVGPRPPLPREVADYNSHHMQRLLVKPGCTGLWQVSERNEVGFEEMVELDLIYMAKRSFFYDIKLIVQTVLVILRSKAY